jgi:HlyD family secretion protein
VKLLVKLVVAMLFVGTTVPIVIANFLHDANFYQLKWRLDREPPLEVRLAPVQYANITRTIEAPGKVEADSEAKISAQVLGRIIDLPVKEGDFVKKDQSLLVQLDRVQYEADVHSAESRVERLKASIALSDAELLKSRRDMERNRRLFGEHAGSQADMIDSVSAHQRDQAKLAMARAELIEAESALTRAKEDLSRTTIKAPINGIVSQLIAKEGEVVVVGTMNNAGTVIMEISDPNSMVVRARIDENNVPLVQPGQKALVHFQNNARLPPLAGTVKRISPKGTKNGGVAGTTSTNDNEPAIFETIIALDSPPPQVRLGMSASVEVLVEGRTHVLSVPAQAVLHRRAKDLPRSLVQHLDEDTPRGPGVKDPARRYHQVVFVNVDGKAQCRLVQTGISDEHRVELLSGLSEGEQVIAGPYRVFDKLKEGRSVAEATANDEANE